MAAGRAPALLRRRELPVGDAAEAVGRLGQIGMLPRGGTPAEFAAFFADQRARLGALIREQGIRAE